jgi:hypothetical protein
MNERARLDDNRGLFDRNGTAAAVVLFWRGTDKCGWRGENWKPMRTDLVVVVNKTGWLIITCARTVEYEGH